MMRSILLTAFLLTLAVSPTAAQSVFATRGFGVPVAPVDARARVLGGIGVGLLGPNASLVNPASVAGAVGRGATAVMQPTAQEVSYAGKQGEFGNTRFPLMHVVYPFAAGRMVASVGYGSFLDQSWTLLSEGTEQIGSETVEVRDRIVSQGGVSQVRAGLAYRVSSSFAVGGAAGLYTGSLNRSVIRSFPGADTSFVDVDRFETRLGWEFNGPLASVGMQWDPASFLRLGASVTWGGDLTVTPSGAGEAERSLDLPLQASAGASAYLAPRLLAALSGQWTGWSAASGAGGAGTASRDTWDIGGGLEWGGPQLAGRSLPVRLGFHYGQYPFEVEGQAPTEWAVGMGLGLRLAGSEDQPFATIDTGLERGSRAGADAAGLTEDFWRFTLSLSVFGP